MTGVTALEPEEQTVMERTFLSHGYEYIKPIGEGGFSTVYLVHSRQYNRLFCIKRTSFKRVPQLVTYDYDPEIQTLMTLNHPNIIRLFSFFRDPYALYTVLEYYPDGSVRDKQLPLPIGQFLRIARDLLQALDCCHDKNIAHRDIKPANILIDTYGRAILADFGLAHQYKNGQLGKTVFGSRFYMAPELGRGTVYNPFKADIWSLGATFYFIVTGTLPWIKAGNELELRRMIDQGNFEYPDSLTAGVKELISSMLQLDPAMRLSTKELLAQVNQLMEAMGSSQTMSVIRRRSMGDMPKGTVALSRVMSMRVGRMAELVKGARTLLPTQHSVRRKVLKPDILVNRRSQNF